MACAERGAGKASRGDKLGSLALAIRRQGGIRGEAHELWDQQVWV